LINNKCDATLKNTFIKFINKRIQFLGYFTSGTRKYGIIGWTVLRNREFLDSGLLKLVVNSYTEPIDIRTFGIKFSTFLARYLATIIIYETEVI